MMIQEIGFENGSVKKKEIVERPNKLEKRSGLICLVELFPFLAEFDSRGFFFASFLFCWRKRNEERQLRKEARF